MLIPAALARRLAGMGHNQRHPEQRPPELPAALTPRAIPAECMSWRHMEGRFQNKQLHRGVRAALLPGQGAPMGSVIWCGDGSWGCCSWKGLFATLTSKLDFVPVL